MGRSKAAWVLLAALVAGMAPMVGSVLPQWSGGCTMMCCCCRGRCCMMHDGKMSPMCPMMAAMRRHSSRTMGCACALSQGAASTLPATRGDFSYILPQIAALPISREAFFLPASSRASASHGFFAPAEQPPKSLA
jgi:hypothetical protein